jgi:hypothetical protein
MSENADQPKYESKTVRAVRGLEGRTRTKWEGEGWEFVSQEQGRVQTTLTFRRPAPKSRRLLFIIGGAAFALILTTIITVGVINERNAPVEAEPTATAEPSESVESPSATPTSTPVPTPTEEVPAVSPASNEEVLAAFQGFVNERAAANVLVAQAVTSVTFENGVVRIAIDPAAVGYDEASFRELVPFENLAEIFITPMAFNDDIGPRLRASVSSVETVDAAGGSRGSRTTEWVVEANELG